MSEHDDVIARKRQQQAQDERLFDLVEDHRPLYEALCKIAEIEAAHVLAKMGTVPLGHNPERYGALPCIDMGQYGASMLYYRGLRDGIEYLMREIDSRLMDVARRQEKQNASG